MPTIHLATAASTYPITIAANLLPTLATRLRSAGVSPAASLFIVTSPEIWALWGETILTSFPDSHRPKLLLLPPGERHKRLAAVESLAQQMALHHADRDAVLLALGGGVIGDITGFLAAVYMRGVRYVQLPTTLLAQVDSSVGGKTGVNLAAGKNLVGSFHHPIAVFADSNTLRTLPAREFRAGMHEVIKAGLLGDAHLFRRLERDAELLLNAADQNHTTALTRIIAASVRVKAGIVAEDERESGRRMLLNLGHTIGHALETATHYRTLLHGEAIAWGLITSLHLALGRHAISPADAARAERLIHGFGPLPRARVTAEQLVTLSSADKKVRGGVLSFVLPVAIGRAEVVRDVTREELLAATQSMLAIMHAPRTAAPSAGKPQAAPTCSGAARTKHASTSS